MMNELQKRIQEHEGFRAKPYRCTEGRETIGIGRNIQDKGITLNEALYLLENDINEAHEALKNLNWYKDLDEVRQGVLIEMCFNIGVPGFLKFKKTISYIQNKDWLMATRELCDSTWARQVSKDRVDDICYRLAHGKYR